MTKLMTTRCQLGVLQHSSRFKTPRQGIEMFLQHKRMEESIVLWPLPTHCCSPSVTGVNFWKELGTICGTNLPSFNRSSPSPQPQCLNFCQTLLHTDSVFNLSHLHQNLNKTDPCMFTILKTSLTFTTISDNSSGEKPSSPRSPTSLSTRSAEFSGVNLLGPPLRLSLTRIGQMLARGEKQNGGSGNEASIYALHDGGATRSYSNEGRGILMLASFVVMPMPPFPTRVYQRIVRRLGSPQLRGEFYKRPLGDFPSIRSSSTSSFSSHNPSPDSQPQSFQDTNFTTILICQHIYRSHNNGYSYGRTQDPCCRSSSDVAL